MILISRQTKTNLVCLFKLIGLFLLLFILTFNLTAKGKSSGSVADFINSKSVYVETPIDNQALYFTPENFNITNDGKSDVSDQLQAAINSVKDNYNCGIIFIPSGRYALSKTIYIPTSVRLIGYGQSRPLFILSKNSPGYDKEYPEDKGNAKYLFWFTSNRVESEDNIKDANSGTFYSAFSNIDVKIEKGNNNAVAFRTHYAQHSFVSHCRIEIGDGKAGIFDVGNELENVEFIGGDYGIYTTRTSPSWQMTMVNSLFRDQRKACIYTEEGGWVMVRNIFINSPVAIEVKKDRSDKIYMEDCVLEQISKAGLVLTHENYSPNQISICNTYCSSTPIAISYRESGKNVVAPSKHYFIKEFTHGMHLASMGAEPEFKSVIDVRPLEQFSFSIKNDIPALPSMNRWVNVKELGVKGDGESDDTEAIQTAIDNNEVLYFPQGWYRLTNTIKLKENSILIGLNPISTVFYTDDSTPAFSGFGSPVPLVETPVGGKNIMNGIGISTGAYNFRGVGCKWQSGAGSYMNDVRFLGGHGNVAKKGGKRTPVIRRAAGVSTQENPVNHQGKDKAWDNQYWSLWITNGGGGTFKDIWTPNTYSTNGLYISNTDTPSAMYEVSVEHHVRNEVRIQNVKNWKFYALQLEEELRESGDVMPIEIVNSSNLMFANLYLFRVIWIDTPLACGVRTWNCKDVEFYNVHNFTQMHHTIDITLKDINTGQEVLPWEFTRLSITGNEKRISNIAGRAEALATGFEYLHGLTKDNEGNIYMCEQRMRRIYKYSPKEEKMTLIADYPWDILSLSTDTKGNLLVCVKYTPQPGFVPQERVKVYPDRVGTTFSWWGNEGFEPRFFSIDPNDPDSTFKILPKKRLSDIKDVERICLPSHRWRDLNDFDEICNFIPEEAFVALDGVTVIPDCYDLVRSTSLVAVAPNRDAFISDEYNHRVVKMNYSSHNEAPKAKEFANVGQFSAASNGDKVFIADGYIYVYKSNGTLIDTIKLPHRPTSIVVGDDGYLYAGAISSLYRIKINN